MREDVAMFLMTIFALGIFLTVNALTGDRQLAFIVAVAKGAVVGFIAYIINKRFKRW